MTDIFNCLIELNLSLQGTKVTIFHVSDKINATIAKFNLWVKRVEQDEFDSFTNLYEFIKSERRMPENAIKEEMINHLKVLSSRLRKYFPELDQDIEWIRNPFHHKNSVPYGLKKCEQDELITLANDGYLKNQL